MRRFVIAVEPWLPERLEQALAVHRRAEAAWLAEQEAEVEQLPTAAKRREGMRAVRATKRRLRESGELLGSRQALLAHHLRQMLAERGWDKRRWAPLPAGARRPGRVRGTPDEGLTGRVTVELPDDLAQTLVRIAFGVSAKATAALEALDEDVAGQSPRTAELVRAALWGTDWSGLRTRDALAKQIVTTGDLLREAMRRAIAGTDINAASGDPALAPISAQIYVKPRGAVRAQGPATVRRRPGPAVSALSPGRGRSGMRW